MHQGFLSTSWTIRNIPRDYIFSNSRKKYVVESRYFQGPHSLSNYLFPFSTQCNKRSSRVIMEIAFIEILPYLRYSILRRKQRLDLITIRPDFELPATYKFYIYIFILYSTNSFQLSIRDRIKIEKNLNLFIYSAEYIHLHETIY